MLKLERQKPDIALGIAIAAHAVLAAALIWNSSIAMPRGASPMPHVNEAESTVDIIMFADKIAGVVRKPASNAGARPTLPSEPEFQVPELSDGDVLAFRAGSVLSDPLAIWATPPAPTPDSTRTLDIHELAGGPRFTSYSRAPSLRNKDDVQTFLKRHFPQALRRAGGEVRAIVWLLIDTRGSVFKAVLHDSSGRTDADSVALQASYFMQFEPAEQAGQSVPVWVQQPVRFQVQDVF